MGLYDMLIVILSSMNKSWFFCREMVGQSSQTSHHREPCAWQTFGWTYWPGYAICQVAHNISTGIHSSGEARLGLPTWSLPSPHDITWRRRHQGWRSSETWRDWEGDPAARSSRDWQVNADTMPTKKVGLWDPGNSYETHLANELASFDAWYKENHPGHASLPLLCLCHTGCCPW